MSTQPPSSAPSEAACLHYGDGEFAVLSAGAFVRCAISGAAIPLTALRYWSVEKQEAYVGPREYLTAARR